MKIRVVIPSYNRANALLGKDSFREAVYVVRRSQRRAYVEQVGVKRVLAVDDGEIDSGVKARNWILANIPRPLLMMDDDVIAIDYYWNRLKRSTETHYKKTLTADEFLPWIERGFLLAKGFGAKLWGICQTDDTRNFKEQQPFSLSSPVLGPFQAHLDHELFYDSTTGNKDDYDFNLQVLSQYGMVLRFNRFFYRRPAYGNEGGANSNRTLESGIHFARRIERKWGESDMAKKQAARRRSLKSRGRKITASKKKPKTAPPGRPRIEIDKDMLDLCCRLQATEIEIAAEFECSIDTINRFCRREFGMTFREYFATKRKAGLLSLRRAQFLNALDGNTVMQKWLGIQMLKQSDRVAYDPPPRRELSHLSDDELERIVEE